jgi:hypothetical protein
MKLIDEWRLELNRLWSIRAAIFTALIAAGDQIISILYQGQIIPPGYYSAAMIVLVILRLLDQKPSGNA